MLTTRNREAFLLTRTHLRSVKSSAPQATSPIPEEGCPDPFQTLQLRKEDARHTTEIHFGSRGIKNVHPNFQYFVNLESLWLNDNHLESVQGLFPSPGESSAGLSTQSGCVRLRRLYLSNNEIAVLGTDLQRLRFLEVLLLSGNKLSNMEAVVQRLKPLRYLKHLDLFGNPLAEEKNYRQYFIVNIPSLEILDRHVITDRERMEAPLAFLPREERAATTINRKVFKKLSPSVELLEQKVKSFNHRDRVEMEKNANAAAALFDEQYQRRKAFHAKWPGKPYVPPEDPKYGLPGLFTTPDGFDLDNGYLIPERIDPANALTAKSNLELFEDKYLTAMVTQSEYETLKSTLGTNTITLDDVPSIVKLLGVPPIDVVDLRNHFRENALKDKASFELRPALLALMRYTPFVEARKIQLQKSAQEAMTEGNADGCLTYVKRVNMLQDVVQSLSLPAEVKKNKPQVGGYFAS
eukprot:PhF_6_TR30185/c0_g1_i1/m.44329